MADDELEEDTSGNAGNVHELKYDDFFHGQLSQAKADELLGQYEPEGNYFLVRERLLTPNSEQPDAQFCISLHTKTENAPIKVHFRVRQSYDLWIIGGLVFHSLPDLVAYYMRTEIYPGVRLQNAIPPRQRCPTVRRVMTTLSYTKSPDTAELSFTAGDVCLVEYKSKEGWIWVTHVKTNETGWVYETMVEDLNSPNYDPELESCEFYHAGHREERLEQLKLRATGTYFLLPQPLPPDLANPFIRSYSGKLNYYLLALFPYPTYSE